MTTEEIKTQKEASKSPLKEIIQPFIDLAYASRPMWAINTSNFLEGLCYFGWLTLLAIFFNRAIGLNDHQADLFVGFLTGGITLSMFFLGGVADKWGVRKAIIFALFAMFAGRMIIVASTLFFSGGQGAWSSLFWASAVGIVAIVIGYGLYQPALYSAVKHYCDERTSAMAYAMIYALMNLGAFLPGFVSPPIRKFYGITGVFWFYVAVTLLNLIIFAIILTRKTEKKAIETAKKYSEEHAKKEEAPAVKEEGGREKFSLRKAMEWFKKHPLADPRFTFFIFILIPVQTLFAHNWLTLPQYVDRALGKIGSDYMEFFVNLNPILIFILTPMVAAMTRKANVYKMMVIGTFVMAAPTFLLAIKPSIWLLLGYLVIMSVGEAMWQPRFLQYAAEIAPPGRTGAYMGVAQFPWFLTKIITATYAGWFLMRYCPEPGKGLQNTTTMWFIYGCIAILSPLALLIAKKWVQQNFKVKHA